MKKRLVSFLLVFLLSLTAAGTGGDGVLPFAEITASAAVKNLPVIDVNNDSYIAYKTAIKEVAGTDSKLTPYLYNFNTVMSSGYDSDGRLVDIEANYGITAYMDGQNVNIKAYDYSKKPASVKSAVIANLDKNNGKAVKLNIGYEYKSINTSNILNGLYRITVRFTGKKDAWIYVYVNGNETWLCNMQLMTAEKAKEYRNERTSLAKVIKDGKITTKNSLDTDGIYYPFYPFPDGTEGSTWRCDTQRWIDLSNTLVKKSWSKEHKLFVFYEWINENIAYDNYMADTLNHSRARSYGDYSGKYSVYNLKTGNCFDFAHILLIMCRAHDIPAITIGSDEINHEWNAVYINNHWLEIDAVYAAKYEVNTADTTKRTNHTTCNDFTPFTPAKWCSHQIIDLPSDAKANQQLQTGYKVY
ncbi:MAG: transglutaminase-like domain-containing protein [Oscillospiraceae bacterium]|nr:transglutaminase-like domain-containing protein [Oscillospiraceae bacterium]